MILAEPNEIHPYTPQWEREFFQIGSNMRRALGDSALRIDHIGSISIPGLAAKPIIDIQISVQSLEPVGGQQTRDRNQGFPMLDENIINLR